VPVGQSSLIGVSDYADTFTGTFDGGVNSNRQYVAAVQPASAYVIENTFGHPSANFQSPGQPPGVGEFSFATEGSGRVLPENPSYPGDSGAGSVGGFSQTGGGADWSVPFGLRSRYLVQFDAVTVPDRIDITSGSVHGGGIFQPNSLSIFFRGTNGGVSLFNGSLDTPVPGYNTGITAPGVWRNYAALFDQDAKTVELFVDEQSKGVIDLTQVAGGLYQNFSNAAVGGGGASGVGDGRVWTDNFQVGAPVPEPVSLATVALAGLTFLGRRRRSRA
jgi:hypothetical protein